MDMINNEELEKLVKSKLKEKRYNHVLSVTRLALELAEHYGANKNDAFISAMLHDITKEQDKDAQLQIIKKSDIILNAVDEKNTNLYHAMTAYLYARDEMKIQNADVLNAIRFHTTGRVNMSLLEKIVYTADVTSYERDYNGVDELRKLAFSNLDESMIEIMTITIPRLMKKKVLIAIDTIDCYNELIQIKNQK